LCAADDDDDEADDDEALDDDESDEVDEEDDFIEYPPGDPPTFRSALRSGVYLSIADRQNVNKNTMRIFSTLS
jgi:hypothetical protein